MKIRGVDLKGLIQNQDNRGSLTEIFRQTWAHGENFVQWNYVKNCKNVLRGVHVHADHSDYLICIEGEMLLGLHDIRPNSVSFGVSQVLKLSSKNLHACFIPNGVAHGFYFPVSGAHIYGVTHYWNLEDELGCRWDDPALGLDWPVESPSLSERDQTAGTLEEMRSLWLQRSTSCQ